MSGETFGTFLASSHGLTEFRRHLFQNSFKLLGAHGFDQVMPIARDFAACAVGLHSVATHCNCVHWARQIELTQQFPSIAVGQADIGNQHVTTRARRDAERTAH